MLSRSQYTLIAKAIADGHNRTCADVLSGLNVPVLPTANRRAMMRLTQNFVDSFCKVCISDNPAFDKLKFTVAVLDNISTEYKP
jgi:hypothetical protein